MPAYRYLGETQYTTIEYYNPARTRSRSAALVLNLFASIASSVVLAKGVDRNELFESYDIKLWSFNDHVALFALATLPSIAILAGVFGAFKILSRLRSAFAL